MAPEPAEWERNTPAELVPAIKHIRDSFDTSASKCSRLTEKLCYAALHPHTEGLNELAPYMEALVVYRGIIGPQADKEFTGRLRVGIPPSIFKAFFEAHLTGLRVEIRNHFDQVVRIGVAKSRLLSTSPVVWATRHLELLIRGIAHRPEMWIKSVCDKQAVTALGTEASIEEEIFWKSWRAPKLIHMEPSGNTPYDPVTAWEREDERRTQELCQSLSRIFVQYLEIHLEHVAGRAHVQLAQVNEQSQIPQKGSIKKAGRFHETTSQGTATWDTVEILFLSDERVSIRTPTLTETRNYAEFGFQDDRSEKPNQAWATLRVLAQKRGTIRNSSDHGGNWPRVEKRVQAIRQILKKHFGISGDPLPFVKGTGYQAVFKITCSESFRLN
jgi:hypothetical protein